MMRRTDLTDLTVQRKAGILCCATSNREVLSVSDLSLQVLSCSVRRGELMAGARDQKWSGSACWIAWVLGF